MKFDQECNKRTTEKIIMTTDKVDIMLKERPYMVEHLTRDALIKYVLYLWNKYEDKERGFKDEQ
jgi:hypothetical protein